MKTALKAERRRSAALTRSSSSLAITQMTVFTRRLGIATALFLASQTVAAMAEAEPSQEELNVAGQNAEDWLITNKDYAGIRYSALKEITKENAANLDQVCTFDTGMTDPAQHSPLAYKGVLYFAVGDSTFAIDGSNCKQIWRHDWQEKAKPIQTSKPKPERCAGPIMRTTPCSAMLPPRRAVSFSPAI